MYNSAWLFYLCQGFDTSTQTWRFIAVRCRSSVSETFFFFIFPCVHVALTLNARWADCTFTCALRSAPFALILHKAPTVRSPFVQWSLIVQLDNIIFRLILTWLLKHDMNIPPVAFWINFSSPAFSHRSPLTSAHANLEFLYKY